MQTYLIRIRCLSPYLTPWRSCTLWGRLCWDIVDGRIPGWDIDTWCEMYSDDIAPLAVSDGFAAGALPVPSIVHATGSAGIKYAKSLYWEDWLKCSAGEMLWEDGKSVANLPRELRTHVVMKRDTGSALDGNLRSEIGWRTEEILVVAMISDLLDEQSLSILFQGLCAEGWGQGRTYGYGNIELKSIEAIERPAKTGKVVTLGHCHPTEELSQKGYWRWTGVPVRPHDDERKGASQFSSPMLLPGATFLSDNLVLGGMAAIEGRKNYQHCGIVPTWPINVREK